MPRRTSLGTLEMRLAGGQEQVLHDLSVPYMKPFLKTETKNNVACDPAYLYNPKWLWQNNHLLIIILSNTRKLLSLSNVLNKIFHFIVYEIHS